MTEPRTTVRRVIVTGGSSGIGQAIAIAYCRAGASIVSLDRASGDTTATICGPRFHSVETDLSIPAQIADAFARADAVFDGEPPDLFVGCAALSRAASFLDVTPGDLDAMLAVNVRGFFLSGQEAARRMVCNRHGHIVHITSVAAAGAWAAEPVYCATKGAQMALTQAMAVELAPFGILVNAVGPGPIAGDNPSMADTRADPEVLRHDPERIPLDRFGRPEEIVHAVMHLAESTWTTGQTLYVDGGMSATGLAYFGEARKRLVATHL